MCVKKKNKYHVMRAGKENLPANHCLIHMDFSTCALMEAVQSGYWAQEAMSIHSIVYYRDTDNKLAHKSFVALSDEKAHTT